MKVLALFSDLLLLLCLASGTGCGAANATPSPRYVVCLEKQGEETCTVIDENGNMKLDLSKSSALTIGEYNSGYSVIAVEGKYGLLDSEGEVVISPSYVELYSPSEGVLSFLDSTSEKYGYLRLDESVFLEPTWTDATSFRERRASVLKLIDGERLWGAINRTGDLVIDFLFTKPVLFREGRAVVQLSLANAESLQDDLGSLKGYVDIDGNAITKFEFDMATPFQNSMALVGRKVGVHVYPESDEYGGGSEDIVKYGYLNLAGELVWPMEFDSAGYFNSSGFARVEICENHFCQSGIIKKDGTWKFKPGDYAFVGELSEDRAFVQMDDGWSGYIRGNGEKVFEAVAGEEFIRGVANVRLPVSEKSCGYHYTLVNTNGIPIFPFVIEGASVDSHTLFDEYGVLVADIDSGLSKYHELVLHRESGVIWPPGWNEFGAGEGILCWPELERARNQYKDLETSPNTKPKEAELIETCINQPEDSETSSLLFIDTWMNDSLLLELDPSCSFTTITGDGSFSSGNYTLKGNQLILTGINGSEATMLLQLSGDDLMVTAPDGASITLRRMEEDSSPN